MIYVLENGKIVENGTYKQLISNEGAFCDLMSKLWYVFLSKLFIIRIKYSF